MPPIAAIEPMSPSIVTIMLPTIGIACICAVVWLHICRYLCRSADAAHRQAIVKASASRYSIAARGTPSDRLWFCSLFAVALSIMLYLGVYWSGITPASQAEREFIALVIQSNVDSQDSATRSKNRALETMMQQDYYISRRHFFIAETIL